MLQCGGALALVHDAGGMGRLRGYLWSRCHAVCAASSAGLLYVTTGVHGAHVLVGMVLILLYTLQGYSWSLYSILSTDTSHGLLCIVLY